MDKVKIMQASREETEESWQLEELSEETVDETTEMIKNFVESYVNKEESLSDENWLCGKLKEELPNHKEGEIEEIAAEILSSVKEYDENLADLNEKCNQGVDSDVWLADKISEAGKNVPINEFGNYLNGIDTGIKNANAQMLRTVTTKAGDISQCRNLDGFIAEQHAVNTFNMQAQLKGSPYYAEVLVPKPGETYGLNSFDTVIKETGTNKIVHQYQFKFGENAKTTIQLLKNGNYNNQRFVVPAEQVEEVRKAFPGKTVEAYMGGTDTVSIKSASFTKEEVKKMQLDVQEKSVLPQTTWNSFTTKELALNIGKNAGLAGIQAAAITTGFDLATKKMRGEKIDEDETIEFALRSGADSGIKMAASGALKVVSEKGILTVLPPGTPVQVMTNVACVGIENIKILLKVAEGEFTLSEGLDRMGRTTTAMVYGLGWGATGMAIGGFALSWIPIVGPVVGGLVGGVVGYMAGSKIGNAIYSGVKKVCSVAKSAVSKICSGISKGVKAATKFVKSIFHRR